MIKYRIEENHGMKWSSSSSEMNNSPVVSFKPDRAIVVSHETVTEIGCISLRGMRGRDTQTDQNNVLSRETVVPQA